MGLFMLESYRHFERHMRRKGGILAAGLMVYLLALCVAAGSAWSSYDEKAVQTPDRGIQADLSHKTTKPATAPG